MWGRSSQAAVVGVPPDDSEQKKQQERDSGNFGAHQHSRSGRTLPRHKEPARPATTVWWKLDDLDVQNAKEQGHPASTNSQAVEEPLPCLIFHPQSMFRVVWDLLVLVFLAYFVFAVPYRLCFVDMQYAGKTEADCQQATRPTKYSIQGEEFCFPVKGCKGIPDYDGDVCHYVLADIDWINIIWSTCIDCFFLLDICLNFRTAYYESAGDDSSLAEGQALKLVTSGWTICKKYVLSWFLIDLLGSLPLDLLMVLFSEDENDSGNGESGLSNYALLSKLVRFLKIFRLLKLVRAARIGRIIQKLQDALSIRPGTVQLVVLTFQFVTTAHIMACLNFLVGITNSQFDCKLSDSAGDICSEEDILNGRAVSWITETTIVSRYLGPTTVAEAELDTQYMMSIYWAITTMTTVGYGDIKPFTYYEVVATIFFMMVGASVFSYVVGNISNLMGQLGGEAAAFREKMETVTVFMHDYNVPKDLKLRIQKYYDYGFHSPYVAFTAPELVDLSPALQCQLLQFFRKNILSTSSLFHAATGENEHRILLQLLQSLKHTQHGPGDFIFYEGEVGREVYFVFAGELDVVDASAREIVATFRKGSYLGENALIDGEEVRTFCVKSRGWSDVLALAVAEIDRYMSDFPQLAASVRITAKVRWARLEAAINAHKVLRRARHRASVPGKKLLRIMSRYAEQENLTKGPEDSLSPQNPKTPATTSTDASGLPPTAGARVERDPITGEKLNRKKAETMSREDVEILGDLRTSVFHTDVGNMLASTVHRKGIDKWDWSWDWVDGTDIVDEANALIKEYGGTVLAQQALESADALQSLRNAGRPLTAGEGAISGPQLERVLQKIVFRLDAIDDALESHALLKQMRKLHTAVKASEHDESDKDKLRFLNQRASPMMVGSFGLDGMLEREIGADHRPEALHTVALHSEESKSIAPYSDTASEKDHDGHEIGPLLTAESAVGDMEFRVVDGIMSTHAEPNGIVDVVLSDGEADGSMDPANP